MVVFRVAKLFPPPTPAHLPFGGGSLSAALFAGQWLNAFQDMMSGSVSAGGERLYWEGQKKIINVTRNTEGIGRTWVDESCVRSVCVLHIVGDMSGSFSSSVDRLAVSPE